MLPQGASCIGGQHEKKFGLARFPKFFARKPVAAEIVFDSRGAPGRRQVAHVSHENPQNIIGYQNLNAPLLCLLTT